MQLDRPPRAKAALLLLREHGEVFRKSTLQARVEKVGFPQTGSAVATGTYTLSGVPVLFGIEVTREGTFDFRLIRRDGRWLIRSARIA